MRAIAALILGLLLVVPNSARAQPAFDDPVALIEHVYAPYLGNEYADYPVALYSPALRQLWDDAMARSEEVGMPILDFDPFVNAQDFEITELVVADPVIEGDTAAVAVGFLNFGAPTELRFHLLRGAEGWLIDDIESFDEGYRWHLSEILAADPLLN